MFAYNPIEQNRADRYLYDGQVDAARPLAEATMLAAQLDAAKNERQYQAIQDGVGLVGDAAKKVAAFLVGGPAGAAMAASGGGGGGGGDGGGGNLIGTLISSYANKKAMDAKDRAYTSFFDRHGEDLGFQPEYLEQLKQMPREDRIASFDLMTSQPGQRLGSLQYMNQQAQLYGGGSSRGTGGGGGGGNQVYVPFGQ